MNAVFCFACRHFGNPHSSSVKSYDPSFTTVGFSNWKKAKESNKGLGGHDNSDYHKTAITAWSDYKRMQSANTSVSQIVSQAHQKAVQENRHYIKAVAEIFLFTGQQSIAQRGHRENDENVNTGNFLGLLKLISNHDPSVAQKCVDLPKNAKYTSPKIQNEVLQLLADMIRKQIIEEVKSSEHFALIVDETKDISKTEQISFVLRYFWHRCVHESFLQFEVADALDADSLTKKILAILDSFGLDYKKNLIAQCYDGASVMSGKNSGVATRLQQICEQAVYVHCHAHRLNLVLVDTAKSIREAADFFSLLQRLYVFLSGSYVHNKWKKVQKEMYPGQDQFELHRLSDTRWACRYFACRAVCKRLPAIFRVLDEIIVETNPDRSVDARGLRAQMDFRFLTMLSLFNMLLGKAHSASNILQGTELDLAKASDVIEVLKEEMKEYRKEDQLDSLWQTITDFAERCCIEPPNQGEKVSRRRAHAPLRLQNSVLIMERVQQRSESTKDAFRVNIFYPILDSINAELERRFAYVNCSIMRGIQGLNPKSEKFLCMSDLKPFAEAYGLDSEDLLHELHQAKRLIERKVAEGLPRLASVLQFTCEIEPYKEAFHELYRLCKIAATIPVTSAASERSFSSLNFIKSYLRNAMSDKRLSNLGVINIEKKRSAKLDLDEFVDIFANNHNNRRIVLV